VSLESFGNLLANIPCVAQIVREFFSGSPFGYFSLSLSFRSSLCSFQVMVCILQANLVPLDVSLDDLDVRGVVHL
jgi:hypothetical protein